MTAGRAPIAGAPLSGSRGVSGASTGFSWPMMWVGTGTPAGWVNTDAGDVTGALVRDSSSPTAWSNNPVLALADFLSTPVRGMGETLDWASVQECADLDDQLLGGKPRRTIAMLIDEQRPKGEIEDTLRAAAGVFVSREGPITYLIPDSPVDLSTTLHLQPGDWLTTSLRYSQRDGDRAPNSVSVRYTNTTVKPWAEAYTDPPLQTAELIAGDVDEVPTVINAAWIQDYAEAVRLQKRYFAEYTLGLKQLEFEAFEKAWKIRRGNVIRISNGDDLVAKPIRVTKITPLGFAKVKISATEYDPAMYSDDTPSSPVTPASTVQDPSTVIAPTVLTMTEEVYLDQSQGATIATGAKYLSRFRVTWTHAEDRYRLDYVLELINGTTLVLNGATATNVFVSPAVEQGQLYKASVRTRSVLGFLSAPLEATATALGKLLPPSDVPAITRAQELGGDVFLTIDAATDVDTLRYEWRYYPNGTGTWEAATLIDRVDGLRPRFGGLPVGTHRFYVKAVDSVGQYSTNAKFVDITVTSDTDAFLQAQEFTNPTLTRMIRYKLEGERGYRWLTNHDETWDTLFPLAMTTYTNPVATYGTGASQFLSEAWDLGEIVTGDWSLNITVIDHAGTATYALLSSDDGISYTTHAGKSFTGAARFMKIQVDTTGTMEIVGNPSLNLAAITRKESGGPITSNAGSAKTITLANRYVKAVRINVQPRGTVAREHSVDNVVLTLAGTNSFDVYLFDAAAVQVASDFTWDFEGF